MSIFLTSSDNIVLTTGAAITIDVYASFTDIDTSTNGLTPSKQVSAIDVGGSSNTTIVSAPASGTIRSIKSIYVKNKSTSTDTITLIYSDGSISVELDKRSMLPGDSYLLNDNGTITDPYVGKIAPAHYNILAGAYGDGNPNTLFAMCQNNGVLPPTATNITTSIARCCLFKLPYDLTVRRIRYYGIGNVNNLFRVAIYRYSDKKRLTDQLPFYTNTGMFCVVNSSLLELELQKDVLYFIAVAVSDVLATAGPLAYGPTVAATTGQIQAAPQSLPGSLNADSRYIDSYNFQFAVTSGELPDPAGTLVAQEAWTGGMPAFWLDSSVG